MVDADDFSSLFEEDLAKNAFVSEKKTLISENLNKNFLFAFKRLLNFWYFISQQDPIPCSGMFSKSNKIILEILYRT